MIPKYSIHTGAVTETHILLKTLDSSAPEMCRLTNPHTEDNYAKSCNSQFSNRDGDKEAKLTDCCFNYIYIYIYAFSRRFYPKRLTLHSSYSFYILSALAFPGNRTHDLGVANAMLYQLSYRKAKLKLKS